MVFMPDFVYRVTHGKYKYDLSGYGSSLSNKRWNKKGHSVLYTSENISLALLENIVHFFDLSLMPVDLVFLKIAVPEDARVLTFGLQDLPKGWDDIPDRGIAREFISDKIADPATLSVKVPSVVNAFEHNYIFNSFCKAFKHIRIIESEGLNLDRRIFS